MDIRQSVKDLVEQGRVGAAADAALAEQGKGTAQEPNKAPPAPPVATIGRQVRYYPRDTDRPLFPAGDADGSITATITGVVGGEREVVHLLVMPPLHHSLPVGDVPRCGTHTCGGHYWDWPPRPTAQVGG